MNVRRVVPIVLSLACIAKAQSPLPWGEITSIPALAAQSSNALFYVASYTSIYTKAAVHTDYDLARRDADAFLEMHPDTPTYVVLNPNTSQTCDDVPLPTVARSNGLVATVSIVGYGSNLSSIQKRPNCTATNSTLALNQASRGLIQGATFQGFTVDANHIDSAGCHFYGVAHSTFFDLACGNAKPGADHELEFGNAGAPSAGQDSYLTLYNLKAFDTVGAGKAALLTPRWESGTLVGVTVTNPGTKAYSHQYSRAQIIGPGLATCSIVPTLTPMILTTKEATFSGLPTVSYGLVDGAIIQNAGKCADTSQLYILTQDGVPVMTGMKFSNLVHSQIWNLEPTGATQYGEVWMALSGDNTVIGEHPYTDQTIQIADFANGNQHINTFFDSPGLYGAALYGTTGSFTNAIFSWDSSSYVGSSGFLLGHNHGASSRWQITNSQCTNSTQGFTAVTSIAGPLATTAEPPSHNVLSNVEVCDGSNEVGWPAAVSPF